MTSAKFSVSLTPELYHAIESLVAERDEDRSSIIEHLLREHKLIMRKIELIRQEPDAPIILASRGAPSKTVKKHFH